VKKRNRTVAAAAPATLPTTTAKKKLEAPSCPKIILDQSPVAKTFLETTFLVPGDKVVPVWGAASEGKILGGYFCVISDEQQQGYKKHINSPAIIYCCCPQCMKKADGDLERVMTASNFERDDHHLHKMKSHNFKDTLYSFWEDKVYKLRKVGEMAGWWEEKRRSK
jgi:hypothetical protein